MTNTVAQTDSETTFDPTAMVITSTQPDLGTVIGSVVAVSVVLIIVIVILTIIVCCVRRYLKREPELSTEEPQSVELSEVKR